MTFLSLSTAASPVGECIFNTSLFQLQLLLIFISPNMIKKFSKRMMNLKWSCMQYLTV